MPSHFMTDLQAPRLMQILVITNYYPPFEIGGWEQLVAEVVDHLLGTGHDARVLTSSHRRDELKGVENNATRKLHLLSPNNAYYHPGYTFARLYGRPKTKVDES